MLNCAGRKNFSFSNTDMTRDRFWYTYTNSVVRLGIKLLLLEVLSSTWPCGLLLLGGIRPEAASSAVVLAAAPLSNVVGVA